MGFGWILYFAQRINETRMAESEKLSKSSLVNDSRTHVFFDANNPSLHHFVYVDNLGVLALREAQALAVMGDLEDLFSKRGLNLHETSCGTGPRESLGTILECSRAATLLTPKRFHRLHNAIGALLRRKRMHRFRYGDHCRALQFLRPDLSQVVVNVFWLCCV